jgi:hypothetical protein
MPPGSAFAGPHRGSPLDFEATPTPIYPDDVGPLLATAAALRADEPLDEPTRELFCEAMSRALTGQASAAPG